jgi:HSP20 family protein
MDLVQYDPFSLLRDIDRFFETGRRGASPWMPRIDVFDREDDLVVKAEVPGVPVEDIDVTIEDRTLTITGSRHFDEAVEEGGYHRREIFTGEFKRTIVLPEGMNPEEISAHAENGLLEVTIPRRPEVLPRKVKVNVT